MNKVLAIDPGGLLGWCNGNKSGVEDFRPKRKEVVATRVLKFDIWLNEFLDNNPVEMIVYEKPGGRNFTGIRSHSQLEGIILLQCMKRGLGFVAFSAGEIKKHATGKGNANKAKMLEAAIEKFTDVTVIDDNHADSLWIYDYAVKKRLKFQ